MKRFKIEFLVVVALLTICCTLSSFERVFEKKVSKKEMVYTCRLDVDIKGFTFCHNGSPTDIVRGANPYPPVNTCVYSIITEDQSGGYPCNEAGSLFCCAILGSTCTPSCEFGVTAKLITTIKTKS